uniref:HTH CENPB-type domain-containing protein n=1 Tax=Latimeria chalumnae TaxID=7897 RepID=H3AUL7_LATCH
MSAARKRIRAPVHEDIDEAIHRWFVAARDKNIPVSGDLLKSKAEQFARSLDIENFKCSNGWIERFKKRFKTIVGEKASVDYKVTSNWLKDVFPILVRNYSMRDLYNVDETGLFYQLLPRKTLASSDDNCAGTKRSKQQITLLIGANMNGSNCMLPLFIGKFGKPRYFKNVNTLPMTYRYNSKAWMMAEIWKEWVRTFDEKIKVTLFVDNCPAHPKVMGLKAVTVHFLPPNSTSILQPMDQGVIQCFKSWYQKLLLRKIVDCIGANMSFQVDILQAMHLVRKAWEQVTDKC